MEDVRVLLVDDEALVLRSTEKTLLRAGFDVETARDASGGLARFQEARQAGRPFDVVVVDLHMPGLDGQSDPEAGMELMDALLGIEPDLAVIVLTAFDDVARAKRAVARGARSYFVKGREAGLVDLVRGAVAG